jgi:hypothetical protein
VMRAKTFVLLTALLVLTILLIYARSAFGL